MSDSFNGYHVWLGIPPNEQPPNYYRLLGIAPFETDLDVIDHAADRQMAHVRTFQSGRNSALSQQILNQLATARVCLLNLDRKAEYDRQLRAELASKTAAVPMGKALPMARPAAVAVPRAALINRPDASDEYEIEMPGLAPLAEPTFDDDDGLLPDRADLSAPAIELRDRPRLIDRDASLQRTLVYVFMGVVIVVVIMVLFGLLQKLVRSTDWKQIFTMPSAGESAPLEPGDQEPPPEAPAPPAPETEAAPGS